MTWAMDDLVKPTDYITYDVESTCSVGPRVMTWAMVANLVDTT